MNQDIGPQHDRKEFKRIADVCNGGLVLVDLRGEVVWMDHITRKRVNGELRNLPLPLSRPEGQAIDCFIAPVALTINGEKLTIGVIQETRERNEGFDPIAAIETVVSDSTSWFARTIVDKLKALRQEDKQLSGDRSRASDLDLLSDREREVLGLICEGHSDAEMGTILGLSENTVRNHIASLYRKIGVKRRTAAIIWARERGIVGRAAADSEKRWRRSSNGRMDTPSY